MTAPNRVRLLSSLRFRTSDEAHRVTTFELFFDLVFVFAFTQVTAYMAETHSAWGVLQAMVLLAILWWSWVSYGWLGNQTFVDEGLVRIGMAVAMMAVFVIALVMPEAFEDLEGGMSAPLVLVSAYLVVRVTHLVLYVLAAGDDAPLRRQVLVTSTAMLTGTAIIIAGAIVGGRAQTWLWLLGLSADIALTYATSRGGSWRVHSAAHWTERYGLIVILALGESIVAIGVGVAREPISVPILAGALLAILLSILLWVLYFDVVAIAAEHRLARLAGVERAALAIDGYTYLHFLIISGVLISALGVEEAMRDIGSPDPVGPFASIALLAGTSLYLAGVSAFWRRAGGAWKPWRLAGATVLLVAAPVAAALPALAALGVCTALTGAVAAIEVAGHAELRKAIRGQAA